MNPVINIEFFYSIFFFSFFIFFYEYKMKIIIPTYDRSNRFETLSFLKKNNVSIKDIYIFLASEEEKQKYVNLFGDDYNWIIGVAGLVNQRNFITNYFDENEILLCIDDDIEDLLHKDAKPFLDWIDECINYLRYSNFGILSINPSVNPFYFEQRKKSASFKVGNYSCIGAFQILKNCKDLILSLDNIEDWERSLLYFKKYGGNIRYNDILIKTKYFGKGGLSSQRNKNNYLKSVNKLLCEYPEYIKFNYKKLPLDKYIQFPNVQFRKVIQSTVDVIELPKMEANELSNLYGMLEDINVTKRNTRTNRRGFPDGHRAITFGYVRGRFNGKYDLSLCTKKYPHIYQELLRIGNIYCPFDFSAIHINKDVVCPAHKDSKNVGKSMLLSFGDYTGCNIMIDGKKYDANCSPLIFDGSNLEHYNTDDLIGTKYSLVFFNGEKSK
jgi:hypothetical protein